MTGVFNLKLNLSDLCVSVACTTRDLASLNQNSWNIPYDFRSASGQGCLFTKSMLPMANFYQRWPETLQRKVKRSLLKWLGKTDLSCVISGVSRVSRQVWSTVVLRLGVDSHGLHPSGDPSNLCLFHLHCHRQAKD